MNEASSTAKRIIRPLHATRLTRAVWCLLLAFIVHGATVGVAHSHGNNTRGVVRRHNSFGSATAAAVSEQQAAPRIITGATCLLCQFHQQLAHSLLSDSRAATTLHFTLAPPTANSSISFANRFTSLRGRAPPANSLS